MRSYICFSSEGIAYKLIWLNEDKKGVYVGMYNVLPGGHWSYHADGTKHFKERPKGRARIQAKMTPVVEIPDMVQIVYAAQSVDKDYLERAGLAFRPDDKASAAIFIGQVPFLPDKYLVIDTYILSRSYEREFVRCTYNRPLHWANHSLISFNLFALENFPQHKVGVAIYAAQMQGATS